MTNMAAATAVMAADRGVGTAEDMVAAATGITTRSSEGCSAERSCGNKSLD